MFYFICVGISTQFFVQILSREAVSAYSLLLCLNFYSMRAYFYLFIYFYFILLQTHKWLIDWLE